MKMQATIALLALAAVSASAVDKTYKHVTEYKLGVLDETLRVATVQNDVTEARTKTDSKLGPGGQGIHVIVTDAGTFRVESPVNGGKTFLAGMATGMANNNRPVWARAQAPVIHRQWFLDKVEPGTKVMFASECNAPNKKHPNDVVKCRLFFPDPDSNDHEYATDGDFTPVLAGDHSNTEKVANNLCGTGKLNPVVEAEVCKK